MALASFAALRDESMDGIAMLASTAITAITMSSSIRVKARRCAGRFAFIFLSL
jgi:hypothetical protein